MLPQFFELFLNIFFSFDLLVECNNYCFEIVNLNLTIVLVLFPRHLWTSFCVEVFIVDLGIVVRSVILECMLNWLIGHIWLVWIVLGWRVFLLFPTIQLIVLLYSLSLLSILLLNSTLTTSNHLTFLFIFFETCCLKHWVLRAVSIHSLFKWAIVAVV